MSAICTAIYDLLEADNPMTNRQVFYRLVSAGVIEKTESAYKSLVCRKLADLRRDGTIPYGWIADNTRWMRKPRSYSSVEDMLAATSSSYRRALWDSQDCYVEVWLEKDALAGVLYEVTAEWDVPLMVTRGYPSLSFLHEAGAAIAEVEKPTRIYYFGDWDPSGVDIPRAVEAGLRTFAPDAEIEFQRVAVNPHQIDIWQLPTRPTKTSDTRAKGFDGESVEVDAIPPDDLRLLCRSRIESCVDEAALATMRRVEKAERESLMSFASRYPLSLGADNE
jgi:hypothetical protein